MSWDNRLLSDGELREFSASSQENPVEALLRQQIATWPMLREAVAALDRVECKNFSIKDAEVLAQFNPKRIVSTGAKVDAATIQKRPCFLCVENLPAEEKGIGFGADFVILCNPFPVLRDHLVISSRLHTPQTIEGQIGTLLELAKEFGRKWFVLYNGPRCGASAPDHLHFQACPRMGVPMFADFGNQLDRNLTRLQFVGVSDYRIRLMIGCGGNREQMIFWFNRAINHLSAVIGGDDEPMINLIVTYQNEQWMIFILPRGKHRPDCYFAEGEARLTISPAAIDLAGVMVVPEADHFARITGEILERVYDEVTISSDKLEAWLAAINGDDELRF